MATNGSATKKNHWWPRWPSKQNVIQGLVTLYTPDSFEENPQCVDIIAVPGLGSDMTRTWMLGDLHWLQDSSMLPKAIPYARISVFGYHSQWIGGDAVENNLPQIAKDLLRVIKHDRRKPNGKHTRNRPIIFLGHSLGGLVVAKTITTAKRQPEDFPNIINCITACVFLGTPFRGSRTQTFAKVISTVGEIFGLGKYNNLLRSLEYNSRELDSLADEFVGDVDKAQIDLQCYYELEKTARVRTVVVDQKSSTFDGKDSASMARDHTGLNKFKSPDDTCYIDVSGTLGSFAQQAVRKIKLRRNSKYDVQEYKRKSLLDALYVTNPKSSLEKNERGSENYRPFQLRKQQKYNEWRDDQASRVLFICGGLEKGKTRAAISIVKEISELQGRYDERYKSIGLAFFFCNERAQKMCDISNVLKCLAHQLIVLEHHLARHFFEEIDRLRDSSQKKGDILADVGDMSLLSLWRCLERILNDQSLDEVYLIIDRLDHLDPQSQAELLEFANSSCSNKPAGSDVDIPLLKWLFLSGRTDGIDKLLKTIQILNVDTENHSPHENDDFRRYVNEQVSRLAKAEGYSRSLEYSIRMLINSRHINTSSYDWVALVLSDLKSKRLQHNVVKPYLENLPHQLSSLCEHISHRVLQTSNVEAQYAKDILQALLLIKSPPTLDELAVIADLPEKDLSDQEAIRGWVNKCGGLVTVFKQGSETRVQLSQHSVRGSLKKNANNEFSMGSENIQHGVIALRCLEYLHDAVKQARSGDRKILGELSRYREVDYNYHADVKQKMEEDEESERDEQSEEDEEFEEVENNADTVDALKEDDENGHQRLDKLDHDQHPRKEFKALRFCYTQWMDHAVNATPDVVEHFGLEDVFWAKLVPGFDDQSTPLHFAAYFGYLPLADLLFKHAVCRKGISLGDSNGHQPLYLACSRGHFNMTERLCEEGADVNYVQRVENGGLAALHGAVSSGNAPMVATLLKRNAKVDTASNKSGTALYIAAERGRVDIAKLLLEKQASPNCQAGSDFNPLNAASKAGSLELMELLIGFGAQVNPSDCPSGNGLHMACRSGNKHVVQYLLDRGCDYTKKDSHGRTPLMIAASKGSTDVIPLLKHDSNGKKYDSNGKYLKKALNLAVKNFHTECVNALLKTFPSIPRGDAFREAASHGDIESLRVLYSGKPYPSRGITKEVKDSSLYRATGNLEGDTVHLLLEWGADPNAEGRGLGESNALQVAASDSSTGIFEMLLNKGANVHRPYAGSQFGTALQAACFEGTVENVDTLLKHGASVNPVICGEYGTPLQAASSGGFLDIVNLLLANDADPNTKGGKYSYAIIAAAQGGYDRILKVLIQAGAEVNVTNIDDGRTPLMNAAESSSSYGAKLLCSHGAKVGERDKLKDTALLIAASKMDAEMTRYLLEQGEDGNAIGDRGGALYRAVESGSIENMKVLLEYKVNVNQEGGALHSPLQKAASYGDLECASLLLKNQSRTDLYGGKYHSPLQAATHAGSVEVTELLLRYGADANAKGGKYGTALHAAVTCEESHQIPLIDLLLKHGASINAVTERGTVLHSALALCGEDVITHLLDNSADPRMEGSKCGTPLEVACYMGLYQEVKLLLGRGAVMRGNYFRGALNAAAAGGFEDVLTEIMKLFAPVSTTRLNAALHFAVKFRASDTVRLLLDRGANVEASSWVSTSAFEALEKGVSRKEERENLCCPNDWFSDDDDDDENDEGGDSGPGPGDGDWSEGYDSDYWSESYVSDDEESERGEAAREVEIRHMLEDALRKKRMD